MSMARSRIENCPQDPDGSLEFHVREGVLGRFSLAILDCRWHYKPLG